MASKYYLTTAIPYVNARPHIGFAYELIMTDVLARYRRQQGDQVFYLTGADENSLKNVQAAEKEGIETKDLVNRNTQQFIDLLSVYDISNNSFIRTTSPAHFSGAQNLWSSCRPEDIYKKHYKGLYCVGCEAFYQEKDLVDGKCPEHKTEPELVEEENYFFKLSNYQSQLDELIASDTYRVVPETRKNEVLSVIRSGLHDFSISRSMKRARNWGVPVPGDDDQVVYVWFDALSNYMTGIGYPGDMKGFKAKWPADVHVIGKGIIRFHAIYWPAMLLSAGLPIPKVLLVHGYVNIGGEKISKSLGNTVDPFKLSETYGADAARYFLMREIPSNDDGDFTIEKFEQRYNADLANDLGNLVSRTLTMIGKYQEPGALLPTEIRNDMGGIALEVVKKYREQIDNYLLHQALTSAWELVRRANTYIEEKAPWKLVKAGETNELQIVLCNLWEALRFISVMVYPFIPRKAEEIWEAIGLKNIMDLDEANISVWGKYPGQFNIQKGEILFPRLESREKQKPMEEKAPENLVDFNEFKKLQLKTAVIKAAEPIEGADKLLKLRVAVGGEERHLVAGIAQHYKPEELPGREIVIVANLKPAKIRGELSEGMLLAAVSQDGKMALLAPDKEMGSGVEVS